MKTQDFNDARNAVWTGLLIEEWMLGNQRLEKVGIKGLKLPNFSINPRIRNRYGSWDRNTRVIELAESLFLDHDRGAVVEVLLHEMAHQVVSEHHNSDFLDVSHGEDWKRTCRILGCRESVESCDEILQEQETVGASKVLEKIRKLLQHGQCDSVTEAESEAFLNKARQLMLEHNVELADINGRPGDGMTYIQRPVGLLFKRLPSYYHTLGNLLSEHYFVNYVQTHTKVYDGSKFIWFTRIELFGDVVNVDAAEYVCHQLLRQAEALWKKRRKQLAQPNKRSFYLGLFHGFSECLKKEGDAAKSELSEESRALILREDVYRNQRYEEAYPQLRTSGRKSYYNGESHDAGMAASGDLRIRRGVNGGSKGEQKLLR